MRECSRSDIPASAEEKTQEQQKKKTCCCSPNVKQDGQLFFSLRNTQTSSSFPWTYSHKCSNYAIPSVRVGNSWHSFTKTQHLQTGNTATHRFKCLVPFGEKEQYNYALLSAGISDSQHLCMDFCSHAERTSVIHNMWLWTQRHPLPIVSANVGNFKQLFRRMFQQVKKKEKKKLNRKERDCSCVWRLLGVGGGEVRRRYIRRNG